MACHVGIMPARGTGFSGEHSWMGYNLKSLVLAP